MRFGKKGKLSPRYIGPFEILMRVGETAYKLALPPHLEGVHDVFHVSMLRGYVHDPSHILHHEIPEILPDLSYEEEAVEIMERKEQRLRHRSIPLVLVRWKHHKGAEATWEREEDIRDRYPHLFST